jgi:antitoxin ParD1/3/4
MQHRKTISLTAKDDAFIVGQVESGEYGNASEVVRAGLRLLEQEQLKLAALRQAIDHGDRDASTGRTKTYLRGQLAERLKSRPEPKRPWRRNDGA